MDQHPSIGRKCEIVVEPDTKKVPPRVGAIIVNHNADVYLADCVTRVQPQVSEVIVVDNDSSDNSLELLKKQLPDLTNVKIIQNNKNMGFAVACNIGIRHLDSPYLLFLNPDCLLESEAVDELQQTLLTDSVVGMTGGLLLNPDGSEQPGGRRAVPTPWRAFVRAFGLSRLSNRWPRLFYDFNLHQHPLPDKAIEVEAISGACMLVSREAMEDVGMWDEGYFLHCEDLDWCMRFRMKGWKVMFVPSARMLHIHGVCSRKHRIFVEWHKHKGMMRYYRKFHSHQYPGPLMWLVATGVWFRFSILAMAHGGKKFLQLVGNKNG